MNDIPKGKIYAHKGEEITCQRKHHVATITRDCFVNEVMEADLFQWAEGMRPRVANDALGVCDKCGSYFNGKDALGCTVLHFRHGWR
jgi:hypothetical protein